MKKSRLILSSIVALGSFGIVSAQYHSNSVRLLSQIPLSGFTGTPASGSGCAGYVSPSGKEYAIMGLSNGNAVVNITNPSAPVIVGHIPGVVSQWHEVCVLGSYAYGCTEGGGGVQIIDLTQVDNGSVSLAATMTVGSLSRGHTIQAVPSKNWVVVHGGDINGLRAYNCANPTSPTAAGSWTTRYVHDAVYYKYTSGQYAGKTVCFAFTGNGSSGGLYIIDLDNVDANNKFVTLGFLNYYQNAQGTGPTNFYSHSGSLSSDQKYIYANDELDEANGLTGTKNTVTFVVDVQNLAQPTKVAAFANPINVIDHNSMIQDNVLMLSAYRGGMRVYDLTNPTNLTESGYFDTWPQTDQSQMATDPEGTGFSFNGDWGVWAAFPSGVAILSDINRGFFIVDPSEAKGWGAPITGIQYPSTNFTGDGVKQLRRDDGSEHEIFARSGKGDVIVNFATTATQRNKVDITMNARSVVGLNMDKVTFLVKNVGTGAWDPVGTFVMPLAETAFSIPDLDGATYISATGNIDLKLQLRTTNVSGVKIEVDLLMAKAHN